MKSLHVKKDDVVVVLWGEERGKVGKVLSALPGKQRVLVEGINVVSKAVRKSEQKPKGGIITKELSIPAGKVMLQERYEARKKKRAGVTAAQ